MMRAPRGSGRVIVVWLVVLSGVVSLAYGVGTSAQLMRADPGSARMREISGRHRRGRAGLSPPPISDDRRRRPRAVRHPRASPVLDGGDRVPHRRGPVGRGGLHRHERVGAGQRAHGAGRRAFAGGGARHLLQGRRRHRHARRRPRAARRRGLFHGSHRAARLRRQRPRDDRRARRARLRRLAHLDLRAARRRHLHQGRRCRRRSRRQGRGGYSGGRSAQPRDHRRQRRRQRRRLRRHGRRPVRDLRGHGRRDDGARVHLLRHPARPAERDDLSPRDLRHLPHHLHRRHLFRPARARTTRSWARSTRGSSPPACCRSPASRLRRRSRSAGATSGR